MFFLVCSPAVMRWPTAQTGDAITDIIWLCYTVIMDMTPPAIKACLVLQVSRACPALQCGAAEGCPKACHRRLQAAQA